MHQNARLKRPLSLITALMLAISLLALLPEGVIKAAAADTEYGLWVAGTQVTSANMNDILGDGHVKFDPVSRTLSICGNDFSYGSNRDYRISGDNVIVNTGVEDLTIAIKRNVFLKSDHQCLYSTKNVTITSEIDSDYPNKQPWFFFEKNKEIHDKNIKNPTVLIGENAQLTFRNSVARISSEYDTDSILAGQAGSKLRFENSEVDCSMHSAGTGGETCVYGFTGGITFDPFCYLRSSDDITDNYLNRVIYEGGIYRAYYDYGRFLGYKLAWDADIKLKDIIESAELKTIAPVTGQIPANAYQIFTNYVRDRTTVTWYEDVDKNGTLSSKDIAISPTDTFRPGTRYLMKASVTYKDSEHEVPARKFKFINGSQEGYALTSYGEETHTASFFYSFPATADKSYDLKVAGVQVKGSNSRDILGDGKVSFDPAIGDTPNVLYIKGDIDAGEEPVILSELDNLEIRTENGSAAEPVTLKTDDMSVIVLNGTNCEIKADSRPLNIISNGDTGIYLRQGADLTITDSVMSFKGANAIAAEPRTDSSITITNSEITANCTEYAIGSVNGDLTLTKCYVDDPAGAQIIVPSTNSTNSKYICGAEGNPLKKLHIKTGEKPQRLVGDVNKDGNITADDAIIAARLAAGYGDYAARYDSDVADMNGDGKVTADDAIIIARYAAGYGNYREIYTKYI